MSGAASARWRLPPNTISAALTSSRARSLKPATPSSPIPTMDSQGRHAALSCAIGSATDMRRILILGGTAEARELAAHLAARADLAMTLSLAGRTRSPAPQPVPVRIGGFGGAAGLADYLSKERIAALIDATHPYAATISANAARAAQRSHTPHLALRRAPWVCGDGDRWIEAGDVADAAASIGSAPRRIFAALGRKELAPL